MTISRLLFLTFFVAITLWVCNQVPFVGVFLFSWVPLVAAVLFIKRWRSLINYVVLAACLVPVYVASIGPANTVASLVYYRSNDTPEWPLVLLDKCYPLHPRDDATTLIGRQLIVYEYRWWVALSQAQALQ